MKQPMTPLQQSAPFNAALARLGARPERCEAASVYILRRPWRPALVSRAALEDPEAALALARADVRLINAERPEDAKALRACGFRPILTAQHIADLMLHDSPEAQYAQMLPKWRNRLRCAQAQLGKPHRLHHTRFCPERDAWLLQAEARQQAARRYRGYPPALTEAMHHAAPECLRLFSLSAWSRPLAAMLFVIHGASATYQIGWCGPDGRAAGAHPLLLWRAMRDLHSMGLYSIDLGSVETESAAGLARFKLGAGARARALGGTWARLTPFAA